jgi:hypothetical protein
VLDLKSVKVEEIRQLARGFHDLTIVCIHHSPDEWMWIAALEAGATELCHTLDLNSTIRVLTQKETEVLFAFRFVGLWARRRENVEDVDL